MATRRSPGGLGEYWTPHKSDEQDKPDDIDIHQATWFGTFAKLYWAAWVAAVVALIVFT